MSFLFWWRRKAKKESRQSSGGERTRSIFQSFFPGSRKPQLPRYTNKMSEFIEVDESQKVFKLPAGANFLSLGEGYEIGTGRKIPQVKKTGGILASIRRSFRPSSRRKVREVSSYERMENEINMLTKQNDSDIRVEVSFASTNKFPGTSELRTKTSTTESSPVSVKPMKKIATGKQPHKHLGKVQEQDSNEVSALTSSKLVSKSAKENTPDDKKVETFTDRTNENKSNTSNGLALTPGFFESDEIKREEQTQRSDIDENGDNIAFLPRSKPPIIAQLKRRSRTQAAELDF